MPKHILISILCVLTLTISGCAGLMKSLEDESTEADRTTSSAPSRRSRVAGDEPVYHPRTLSGLSANNVNSYDPPVKRAYNRGPASTGEFAEEVADDVGGGGYNNGPSSTRRLTRSDFVDNKVNENSLWDGQGQSNYLFSNNKRHELGDVVSVDVERDLKREIQYALFMNLPPEQRRVKRPRPDRALASNDKKAGGGAPDAKSVADAGKSELEKGKDAAEEAAKVNMDSGGGKDDEVLRMEVVESAPGGMVRFLGQKRVVYRGVSRVVEIVSLANGKDVDENGKIKSGAFIDTKTQVIQ